VFKDRQYIAVLKSDINKRPQRLSGIYTLSNLAIIFLTLGLGFTGTASSATISQEKEKFAQLSYYK